MRIPNGHAGTYQLDVSARLYPLDTPLELVDLAAGVEVGVGGHLRLHLLHDLRRLVQVRDLPGPHGSGARGAKRYRGAYGSAGRGANI